jgi:NitT/TauT family transport system substrate-binding protein
MVRVIAIVGMLAVLIAGARPAAADDALSVIDGAGTPGFYDLLEFVADGAGFYKEAHLAVTKNYAGSAASAAQLVAAGKIDVTSLSVEPLLIGYSKGLRLQYFFSRQSRYSYLLAVVADSPIRTLADFKGKQIGEPTTGSPVELVAKSLLSGAGLKSTDYSFVPIGYGGTNLQAVLSKKVDGVSDTYSNLITNQVRAGVTYRVFRDPILDDISNVGYVALPSTIASRGDVLKRFARALAKAAIFVQTNPQAAARLYLQGAGEKVTSQSLADTTRIITLFKGDLPGGDPSSHRIGAVSPTGMALLSADLVADGFAESPVPGAAVATNQFIPYANDFDRKTVQALARSMH